MKTFPLVLVSCFTVALGIASGCGGNVVVDTGSGGAGNGGAGSSSNNTAATSVGQTESSGIGSAGTSMTTSGGPAVGSVGSGPGVCSDQNCYVGSDGACGCEVTCNGQLLRARCQPGPSGGICECSINDMPIGKCEGDVAVCDVFASCCGQFFPFSG